MTPRRNLLFFLGGLLLCLALVEAYARRAVRATPAGQTLARYRPQGSHIVFLGSSLTDAGVRVDLLDSLLAARGSASAATTASADPAVAPSATRVTAPPATPVTAPSATHSTARNTVHSFNLALAGLSGSDNYYLLLKDFILPRGRPELLVVEATGLPFFPAAGPFKLEGEGMRVESFRTELLTFKDFAYLSGGAPTPAAALSFWLHKHWFSYHYRLEIQARLHEKFFPVAAAPSATPPSATVPSATTPPPNPYRMAAHARDMFAEGARASLRRLQASSDVTSMLRSREAHLLDLAALAREHGIRLVVLQPPCPPIDEALAGAPAAQRWRGDFARLCDSLNVVYLDLRDGDYRYSDGIHLDAASAAEFTARVAARLASLP